MLSRRSISCFAIGLVFCLACLAAEPAQNQPAPANPPPAGAESARVRALRQALEAQPEDAERHRRLAIVLHGEGKRDEAIAHFERAVELAPSVRGWLDVALAYSSVSRLADSEKAYERLLEQQPNHAIALHNLGNIAMKQGRFERSIELYRRSIAVEPAYVMAHYHLGDALRQSARPKEAFATYEHVLTLSPRNSRELAAFDDALYRMAALHIEMGAADNAVPLLEELLRANPNHKNAHYAYGQALMQVGRTDEAQAAFARHVEIMKHNKPTGPAATGE